AGAPWSESTAIASNCSSVQLSERSSRAERARSGPAALCAENGSPCGEERPRRTGFSGTPRGSGRRASPSLERRNREETGARARRGENAARASRARTAESRQLNRDSCAGAERPEWRDAPRRFAGVERRDLGDRSERSSFQGRVEREVP